MKQKRLILLLAVVANFSCAFAQKWYTPDVDRKVEELLNR